MIDDLKSHYLLFNKLSEKAKETDSLVDYGNAVSLIDLIKSRYLTNNSMIKQHQSMFVEFIEFLCLNYTKTRNSSDLNKFSKYCENLTMCCSYNFDGCYFSLISSIFKDGTFSTWDVNPFRKAYLKELELEPIKLGRYHHIFDRVFNLAQTTERGFPKASKKLYELLTNDAYQGEFDLSNLTVNEREEILADIEEKYLISQGKVGMRKGFF
jgi:hypothetical protein